jgi:hypothetical protein
MRPVEGRLQNRMMGALNPRHIDLTVLVQFLSGLCPFRF